MGIRYWLTLACPHCGEVNEDCYYAPTCEMTTWRCDHCGEVFDIEAQLDEEERVEFRREREEHSAMIAQLVGGFVQSRKGEE